MKNVLTIGILAIALAALAAGAILWDDAQAAFERPAIERSTPMALESSLCDPSIPPCNWPPVGESDP